jgi:hypothetical protein
MTAVELPNWVIDLVNELDEQQELHPKLLFESGAFEGTRQYDWCPCGALKRVPADVLKQARAVAAYRREADKDKEPTA